MTRLLSIISCILLAGMTFALFQPDAEGCASVRRSDRPDDSIRIAEESAIIVWDPVKKVEHFIRRAAFDTKSPDFGFLVPTPTMPTLEKVEDAIFNQMDKWIVPVVVERTSFRFDPISCCIGGMTKSRAPAAADKSVQVLAEKIVGGYQTAILKASSTEDLSNWLKDNAYSSDPELQSWLVPYVANDWLITAFKISQDPKTGQLATTTPVRMSFATDKPFFPYREPEGKLQKPEQAKVEDEPRKFHMNEKGQKVMNDARMLRVHFVSTSRMQATLGNTAWHATVPWTDQLTDEQRQQLAKEIGLAENDLPTPAWLTTFEDRVESRPGKEEVYFEPSQDRAPIRPEIIRYKEVWIPFDVALLLLIGVIISLFLIHRFRRRST